MFEAINEQFSRQKRAASEDDFIVESVLDVDEVLPGSEDEMDDQVDADSVPDEVINRIDAELEKMVSAPEYDDTEAEELVDEDDDISEDELDTVITEACAACWVDDNGIGHPNRELRTGDINHQSSQPLYKAPGQNSL